MVLIPKLDSVDELHEAIREHYVEAEGGGFRLDVKPTDGWALEDVGGLKSTLAKKNDAERLLKAKLEKFGDMDPDAATDALSKLKDIQDWTPDEKVKEQLRSVEKQLIEKHAREMGKAKDRGDVLLRALDDKMRRAEIVAACARHKANPDLVVPICMSRTAFVEEDGAFSTRVLNDDGTYRLSDKAGSTELMGADELVLSMRDDKRYMAAFEGTAASGSGSTGGAPGKPGHIPEGTSPVERIKRARAKGNR